MANTNETYTDRQIMKALLTRDFSTIGGELVDDTVTSVKPAAFMEAQHLSKVSLPSLKTVHFQAFMNAQIDTLDIPWEELENIGYGAFMGASGVPEDLVLTKAAKISQGVFAGTSSAKNTTLKSVSLPVWTGSTFSEGSGLSGSSIGIFSNCSALTSITAPELKSIPTQMCYYCTGLVELHLPKATTFSATPFYYCTALKKLELGGEITRFGSSILMGSTALEALILSGLTSVPTVTTSFFTNTAFAKKTGYIYVPKELEATFKVTTGWSTYATQIRAIEDYPDICGTT